MIIGNLIVRFGSDTKDLEDGGKRSETAMKGVTTASVAAGVALGNLATKAIDAGASFIKDLVIGTIETTKQQVRLSYQLQSSVASIQALTVAGRATGMSMDEIASLASRMTTQLAIAARTGEGPAAEALKRLGVTAKQLLDVPIDERMLILAQRFKTLGYNVQQQADVLRQFGLRSSEVVGLFENGGARIEKARKTIQELGIALSDVDAQTIRDATSDFKTFHNIVEGFGNQLTLKVAPAINYTIEAIASMAKSGVDAKSIVDVIWDQFLVEMAGVNKAIYDVRVEFDDFVGGVIDGLNQIIVGWNKFAAEPSVIWNALLEELMKAWHDFIDFVGKGWDALKAVFTSGDFSSFFTKEMAELPQAALPQIALIENSFGKLKETLKPPATAEQWRDFFDDMAEDAREASEKIVAARNAAFGGGAKLDNLTSEQRRALEMQLMQLRKSIADQSLALQISRDEELAKVKEFERKKLIDKQKADTLRSEIDAKFRRDQSDLVFSSLEQDVAKENEIIAHQYELKLRLLGQFEASRTITETKAAELRKKYADKYALDQLLLQSKQYSTLAGIVDTSMAAIAQTIGKQGGAAFNVMKAISMATALVKGYEAVVSAYAAGNAVGGPALGAVFAAIAAAGVAGQIAAIAATQPTGGSGAAPAAPSSSGAEAAGSGGGGGGGGGNNQTLYVKGINPNMRYTGEQVKSLAEQLLAYQRNGGRVVLAR